MKKLDAHQEGTIAIIAAFIVLFSSMWDPMVSVMVPITALVSYSAYKFFYRSNGWFFLSKPYSRWIAK